MKNKDFFYGLFEVEQDFIFYCNDLISVYFSATIQSLSKTVNKTLTLFDIVTLEQIYANKQTTLMQLAQKILFKPPNMSRIINKLSDLNLIERFKNDEDRRNNYVRFIPAALKEYKKINTRALKIIKTDLMNRFSDENLEQMNSTLLLIISLYDKIKVLNTGKEYQRDGSLALEFFSNLRRHSSYNNYFFIDYPKNNQLEIYKNADLSYDQSRLLYVFFNEYLKNGKRPVPLSFFANNFKIRPCQISSIMNKLEQLNFIRRIKKELNHRIVYIIPADGALEKHIAGSNEYDDYLSSTFSTVLSDEELDQMRQGYKSLLDLLYIK